MFVRAQSKPVSYTEIREEDKSLTSKLVWQQQWLEKKCIRLICFFLYYPPPLEPQSSTSAAVSSRNWSVLFHLWALMCNTNLYDWYVYGEIFLHFLQWWRTLRKRSQVFQCEIPPLWTRVCWTLTCPTLGSGQQEMQHMQHLPFGCWNLVWEHPESPTHCSEGLHTFSIKDYCSKLHMQCKTAASDVKVRSLKIISSGRRAMNLLAMYSSI